MLLQDAKVGLRMMGRTPVVSVVAILSLALAIAGNAAMFALLDGFLLEPLPYADQERLVVLRTLRQGEAVEFARFVSVPNYRDYIASSESFESSAIYSIGPRNLTGLDVPEQVSVVVATPSIFAVLGVQPMLGRGFRAEEGADGSGRVLVLHHDYWQRRFLGDRGVLGRSVLLDGEPHTIVGVMPEGFDIIPADIQAIRPSDFDDQLENRSARAYMALARLRDGATVQRAQLELDAVSERLAAEFPEANRGLGVVVQRTRDFFPGPTDAQLVKILTAVTLFGLLIACANVASLLFGRAEERQKEVAVRTALGAGKKRVLGQMLTESVLMSVIAAGLGLVSSVWLIAWLRAALPAAFPAAMLPDLDPGVLAATLLVAILAGVGFGLAPALHSVSGDLREALGDGARGSTAGRLRRRLRSGFVIAEVAFALALLVGSGLLIQAFGRFTDAELGFDPERLLTFEFTVAEDRYPEDEDVAEYGREVLRVLGEVPGVEGAAVMSSLPRGRNNPRRPYSVDGRSVPDPPDRPNAGFQSVNPEYFTTLGIPLLSGRLLEETDRADAARVVVVSESFVAREFPSGDAIGASITVAGQSRQIVGVVGDILQEYVGIAGLGSEMIYAPIAQVPLRNPSFAVRAEGDPAGLASLVREAVWSVDVDQPVSRLRTFQAHLDEALAALRAIALFLMAMGGIALALAAMGVYGVMAHSVTQQRRALAIRMALGAGRGSVVAMITRSGIGLVAVGVVLGLPLVWLIVRAVGSVLAPLDVELQLGYPIVLSAALIGLAVMATVLPAHRASRIAPAAVLKE